MAVCVGVIGSVGEQLGSPVRLCCSRVPARFGCSMAVSPRSEFVPVNGWLFLLHFKGESLLGLS